MAGGQRSDLQVDSADASILFSPTHSEGGEPAIWILNLRRTLRTSQTTQEEARWKCSQGRVRFTENRLEHPGRDVT